MGNKTLADGTEIYESEFTGEQMDELLKQVKTEEELREFILSVEDGGKLTETEVNQLIADYARENNLGASDEVIRKVCQDYFAEHDITSGEDGKDGQDGVGIQDIKKTSTDGNIDTYTITLTNGSTKPFTVRNGTDGANGADGHTPTTEEVKAVVEEYLREHPIEGGSGTVSDKQIASAVSTYLAENPIEGGMTTEQLNNAISEYLAINPITNVDEDVFEDMADEWIENIKIAGANLPIIFLEGDTTGISKENAVSMKMRFVSQFKSFEDTCTLKYQGTSSMSYPKKNFTMKFDSKHGVGWGKQKKYCLKANYIDHSHARNIVSARLWSQIVSSRPDYEEMPELLRKSPNNGAIDGFPVRLYLNESYQGLYTMNIPKGSWQFKMDDTNENHCILCGENYVSGLFRGSALINESDWSDELHDVVPTSVKTRWNEIISFVMNSTDKEFKSDITNYIDLQSLIDYYIFAYVSTGLDALGKNQIYYTYDGQKYYASMYDMDSTWGMYWNGQRFVSDTYRMQEDYESKVSGRAGNLLYERLENLFRGEIEERYAELRSGILSFGNILAEFEKFMSAITTEQYSDDIAIYSGIPSGTTNNIKQIRSYVPKRLAYVDSMIYKVNIESITLNYETKSVYQEKSFTLTPTFTPSNTNNYSLVWTTDNNNVTVENGKVKGVTVGTSIVTVTDEISGLSASCTVTVLEKQTQEGGDSEISATAIYSLDESTEFNGTSDFIDTGVKLFDVDKDFTIFLEFETASDARMVNYGHNVLNAQIEQSPYYGLVVRYQDGSMCIADGMNNYKSIGVVSDTQKHILIIKHEIGSSTLFFYIDGSIANSMQHSIGTHNQNVILGAYYSGSEYGRFFKGTIHKCAIYDEVLSDDDIGVLYENELENITGIDVGDISVYLNSTKSLGTILEPKVNVKTKLNYESSNSDIVSVDENGKVKGVTVGTSIVTVTDEISGLSASCTVTTVEVPETSTVFYASELVWRSPGYTSTPAKYFYVDDNIVTEKPYITACCAYLGDNVVDSGVKGGSYFVVLATDQPFVSGDKQKISPIDWTRDMDLEVYYTPMTGTEDAPTSFVKAKNSSVITKVTTTDANEETIVIRWGGVFYQGIYYANYDIVASSTDNTVTFEANYNQSDYE